jgi:uncharacterized Zn finger protein
MPRNYDWWESHGPRLPAKGIKAKTQHGQFGKTWWAGRWIAALERLVDPARLARGRSYARSGQVLNLDLKSGNVEAKVQGSRPTPYKVTVTFKPLADAEWERVIDAMAAEAIYAARLLGDEMPEQIEDVFTAAGTPLFPSKSGDMQTDCSCPDWANPCKHVAAVHYLLGERFDEDPFLMFRIRGREKPQILEALRARRTDPVVADAPEADAETGPPIDLAAFWIPRQDAESRDIVLRFALPEADALVLKRLGPPTFARDPAAFVESMERTYHAVSEHALSLALSEE